MLNRVMYYAHSYVQLATNTKAWKWEKESSLFAVCCSKRKKRSNCSYIKGNNLFSRRKILERMPNVPRGQFVSQMTTMRFKSLGPLFFRSQISMAL